MQDSELRKSEDEHTGDPLIGLLGRTFKVLIAAFERDVGIGAPKYFLLELLTTEDGIGQGEVGRRFEVDPSRITRLAKLVESDGLIRRIRDTDDSRVVRMYLTAKGHRDFETYKSRLERFRHRIEGNVSSEELDGLRSLLGKIAQAAKEDIEDTEAGGEAVEH